MEANLAADRVERRSAGFPPANWGPGAAVLALFVALSAQAFLATPVALVEGADGDQSAAASIALQLITAATFFAAPFVLASMKGAGGREAAERLGLRPFGSEAVAWMGVAVGVYLAFSALYVAIIGEPEQTDIAENFGAVPFQVLLIVIAAPISEEICFRGMLFGGLRERLASVPAALISAVIFGALHAFTGIEVVPPLIVFGLILAFLYEKTGSIVPGIILHMLNNSVALLGQ
ncbi:MAG TPA: type II CAAX endopeptidase family protein [Solirubrobacterales bacterium]|jgi:membrane protease YdiL (CAAX protease family)|nr:type II CAAX endopeptidase family protein [Solirubrobacterales bacterium]